MLSSPWQRAVVMDDVQNAGGDQTCQGTPNNRCFASCRLLQHVGQAYEAPNHTDNMPANDKLVGMRTKAREAQ